MLCFSMGVRAQSELTIYEDATSASDYVPVYGTWADAYLKCEFVVPAEELASMEGATISQMTFYLSSSAGAAWTGTFQVFLKEVNDATISAYSGTDDATIVYTGSLDATGSTMSIEFSNFYTYGGGNLLVGVYQTTPGNYKSAKFTGKIVEYACVQGYNSSSLDNVSLNSRSFIPKTTFTYIPAGTVFYAKPTGLSVDNLTDQTATLSWTAPSTDVTGYVYQFKEATETEEEWSAETTVNAPTVTLSDLLPATNYNFRVKAVYDGGESSFATIDFITETCANPLIVNYSLVDSYGDGWNGNAINVLDGEGNILETLTISSGKTATGTLKLCGDFFQFVWVKGNYPDETSWTFTDAKGEVLFSATNGSSFSNGDVLYEIDNSANPRPTDLAVSEVATKTAVLSWTENGNATAWEICLNDDENNLVAANGNPFTLTNLTPETTYTAKVRAANGNEVSAWSKVVTFTTAAAYLAPTDVAASDATVNSAVISWTGNDDANSYNLRYKEIEAPATIILNVGDVWGDGTGYQMLLDADATAFGTVFTSNGGWTATDFNDFEYLIPTNADCSADATNFVLNNSVSIKIPAGTYDWCIVNPSPSDGKIYIAANNGNVGGRADDYVFEAGKTYTFVPAIFGSNDGIDVTITGTGGYAVPVSDEWTVVEGATSPYALDGLNEYTYYQVEVQAVYSDGESRWEGTSFGTLSSNPIPTDVVVTPTHTSATISWTGASDSYEVKYRTAETTSEPLFTEDFESGIGEWTTINLQSGGGITEGRGVENSNGFAFKWTSNPPQYLISPLLSGVAEGNTLKFSYANYLSSYQESFKVGYSTTGNDVETDFTWSAETTVPATTNWYQYELALPAGTKYFAIQCTSDDKYYLFVDDFAIYGDAIPAGEWASVTTDDTSVELTGLEMDTEYEYQIIGIKNDTPNNGTAIASFTTLSNNYKIFTTAGNWDVAENWYPIGVPTEACKTAIIQADVTIPSGVVATAKEVTIDGGSITIKDGGQLIHGNEGVIATVEKNITGYGTNETGNYYLITAPLMDGINPADVENMLTGDYDLYAFDFTQDGQEWRNYKSEAFTLAQGNAYLYANSEDVTLSFTGELLPMPGAGYITYITGNYLNYATTDHPFKNWNLIGNPLAGDAYISLGNYNSYSGLALVNNPEFYTINEDGDAIVAATDDPSAVMGSVFVISQASSNIAFAGVQHYRDNVATEAPAMALPKHGLDTNQDASPLSILELVDGKDNLETIEEYAQNGYIGDVKLTDRTLYKDGGWNTLVLPFAVEDINATPLAGAIVKTLESASFDNGTLTLNFTDDSENLTALDAGVPYIVKWEEIGDNIVDPVFSEAKISAVTENVVTDVVSFIGTYNTIDFGTEVNTSVFLMGAGNTLFYPNGESNSYVNTCRAYFQLADGYELATEASVGQNAKVVRIDFNFGDGHGIATGIVSLDDSQNNAGVYTLSGVKLDKATKKGVYIQNGRKVVIGKNR